jgi:hypothetical protein
MTTPKSYKKVNPATGATLVRVANDLFILTVPTPLRDEEVTQILQLWNQRNPKVQLVVFKDTNFRDLTEVKDTDDDVDA